MNFKTHRHIENIKNNLLIRANPCHLWQKHFVLNPKKSMPFVAKLFCINSWKLVPFVAKEFVADYKKRPMKKNSIGPNIQLSQLA